MSIKIPKSLDYPEFRNKQTRDSMSKYLTAYALSAKDINVKKFKKNKLKDIELEHTKLKIGPQYDGFETFDEFDNGIKGSKKFVTSSNHTSNFMIAIFSAFVEEIREHYKKGMDFAGLQKTLEKAGPSLALSIMNLPKADVSGMKYKDYLGKHLDEISEKYIKDKKLRGQVTKAFSHYIQFMGVKTGRFMYHDKVPMKPDFLLGIMSMHDMEVSPKTIADCKRFVESQVPVRPTKKEEVKVNKKKPNIKPHHISSPSPSKMGKPSKTGKQVSKSDDGSVDESSVSLGISLSSDSDSE